jgi:hypothetical protein
MNPPDPQSHRNTRVSAFAGSFAILAVAALALAPQMLWGDSSGHDFDFHLVSWFDALNSWRHGIPYPHWTPSANFGAGEPRFVFYSPLTWMLGAALAAVLPWNAVPLVVTWILLAGTGLATRALAREVLGEGAAAFAGCIAIFSGYPLFTAYERSAFAELAGGIWIPLVLLYSLRVASGAARRQYTFNKSIAPLALSIAGAWLSNPTVGVMACYLLGGATLIEMISSRSWRPAIGAAAGAALGMGISAFYVLPAAWEQRWVDIHRVMEIPGQILENNWLFARHTNPVLADHDQVLFTVSTIAAVMFAASFGAVILCKVRGRLPGARSWWGPLALIPLAVLLLQFSFSLPLWNLLPDLRFLQFPWRWLLVVEAPMAIFIGAALWPREEGLRRHAIFCFSSAVIFVGLTACANKHLFQKAYPEDTVPGMLRVLLTGKGYLGMDEYEPIGGDVSMIATNLPHACLVSDPRVELGKPNINGDIVWNAAQGTCEAIYETASNNNPEHLRINGNTAQSGSLVLRLLRFPAWQVRVNGQNVDQPAARDDGLIVVPVSAGAFEVTADWKATTDVILARWLSGICALFLACFYVFERRFRPPIYHERNDRRREISAEGRRGAD